MTVALLPVWAGVLLAIAAYVCVGAGLTLAFIEVWLCHDRRRRVARAPRSERAARVEERDAAAALRPHGGVLPACFALDRAERRPRLRLVADQEPDE